MARRLLSLLGLTVSVLLSTSCTEHRPRSVVLVVVDTLRADHLGVYGYDRPTSPEIDRWSDSAVVYSQAFSTSSWTLPSMATLATGLLPTEHGTGGRRPSADGEKAVGKHRFTGLPSAIPTVAEIARANGLDTGAIINNSFLHPRFGLDRGFEDYDYAPGTGKNSRRADVAVDEALHWLSAREGRRFFLLLHIFDPHLPYRAPAPHASSFTDEVTDRGLARPTALRAIREAREKGEEIDLPYLVAAYDEEIAFTDEHVGRFLREVEARYPETMIVLTSDHGEEFLEHGGFDHGRGMFSEVVRVPLLVSGRGAAGRVDVPVSILDIAPTVLEAMELPFPERLSGGVLPEVETRGDGLSTSLLLAENTLYGPEKKTAIEWPFKVTVDESLDPEFLSNLERDRLEQTDLRSSHSEIADRLARALRERLDAALPPEQSLEADIDEDTMDDLRALGYVD